MTLLAFYLANQSSDADFSDDAATRRTGFQWKVASAVSATSEASTDGRMVNSSDCGNTTMAIQSWNNGLDDIRVEALPSMPAREGEEVQPGEVFRGRRTFFSSER